MLAKSFRRVNVAANKSEVSTDREQFGSARNGKAALPGETVQLAWYHHWPRQGLGFLARSIFAMVRLNNHRLWCLSYSSANIFSSWPHQTGSLRFAKFPRIHRDSSALRQSFKIWANVIQWELCKRNARSHNGCSISDDTWVRERLL